MCQFRTAVAWLESRYTYIVFQLLTWHKILINKNTTALTSDVLFSLSASAVTHSISNVVKYILYILHHKNHYVFKQALIQPIFKPNNTGFYYGLISMNYFGD